MSRQASSVLEKFSSEDAAARPAASRKPMDCAEFNLVLAEVLRREALPAAAQSHLRECPTCAAMVGDFEAIAHSVERLANSETDVVPDLWPQIRDALQREGIIHAAGQPCQPTERKATPHLVHRRDAK